VSHLEVTRDINRCALVTASSKGLGRAIANVFATNGYDVILHGRNENKVQETKKFLEKYNVKVYEVLGDLRVPTVINQLYEYSKIKISVLVNNAAIPCYGLPLEEMDIDQIYNSLDTNFKVPVFLTHKIYPLMKRQGYGSIININSIVGKEPKKFRSIHSATKWGLKGFSKSLRIEAEENGIKVINVYPTQIKTIKEFTYGLEPEYVAKKIYEEHTDGDTGELVLDGRPEEFRK
jgi:short-subunit dehydrogenase